MDVTISDFFTALNAKTREERLSYCDSLQNQTIIAMIPDMMEYYRNLPAEDKFWRPINYNQSSPVRISGWQSWIKEMPERYADVIHISDETFIFHRLFLKAGISYWSAWCSEFASDAEIIALIRDTGIGGETLTAILDYTCGLYELNRVKTVLFCYLVSGENAIHEALLPTIRTRRNELQDLCIEVICDFEFTVRYPKCETIYDGIVELYNDADTIRIIVNSSEKLNKGKYFAWARILSFAEYSEEYLEQFVNSYIQWVKETADYQMLFIDDKYYEAELAFLGYLVGIFADSSQGVKELRKLWSKKSTMYHGWKDNDSTLNRWFQHIGLLLFDIGLNQYETNQDVSFILHVLEGLNNYIPMALTDSWYDLLLLNVYRSPHNIDEKVDNLLKALTRKIYSEQMLINAIRSYLRYTPYNSDLLHFMKERLVLFQSLPKLPNRVDNYEEILKDTFLWLDETLDTTNQYDVSD